MTTYSRVINGTSGSDILFGGTGTIFRREERLRPLRSLKGYGSDTISDFQAGVDALSSLVAANVILDKASGKRRNQQYAYGRASGQYVGHSFNERLPAGGQHLRPARVQAVPLTSIILPIDRSKSLCSAPA